jgi:regulator of replication initiation timing
VEGGVGSTLTENERLRMERDILKKSIAIFAGVPK